MDNSWFLRMCNGQSPADLIDDIYGIGNIYKSVLVRNPEYFEVSTGYVLHGEIAALSYVRL